MRFQHVKSEELEGPIKLAGFSEWTRSLGSQPGVASVLLAAPPGTGKGSAAGALGDRLQYDIVRCRLKLLLDSRDPLAELRTLLDSIEHLHRTVFWLDGLDDFLGKLPGGAPAGEQVLGSWLSGQGDSLKQKEVLVVGTAHTAPDSMTAAFERCFSG